MQKSENRSTNSVIHGNNYTKNNLLLGMMYFIYILAMLAIKEDNPVMVDFKWFKTCFESQCHQLIVKCQDYSELL